MYSKDSSLALLILQYSNLALTFLFLILFIYRYCNLRKFSLTDKFKDYFPKMRLFFCLVYIVSSFSLLLYNLLTSSYQQKKWYQYMLQGGGGQCINSVIMIIQLGVLRLQLKKQQPYCAFHIYYFVYVMILSIARLTLTTIDVINGCNDIANEMISSIIMADSVAQLAYWYQKRLPQFIHPTHQQIDQSRYHSHFLQRRIESTKRSMKGDNKENFPFITPYVSIQNGKIHILLERLVYEQQSYIERDSIIGESFLERSILERERSFIDRENHVRSEVVCNQTYSLEEIKKLYILCGRLDLKIHLKFDQNLTQFLKDLQLFLNDLFGQKRWYQTNILKPFNISERVINVYKSFYEKWILTGTYVMHVDNNTGYFINQDKNAFYFSLEIYKEMWVYDHYEFYMRVSVRNGEYLSYPIKRYDEIQQLYLSLRKSMKTLGRTQQLSLIPKKHGSFNPHDSQNKAYLKEMENHLRKLSNQQFIFETVPLKEKLLQFLGIENIKIHGNFNRQFYSNLVIKKGKIKKTLIKEEYVTLYELKFCKNNVEVKIISRRFSQFQHLHNALQKWCKHRKTPLTFSLPQKVALNSQIRHQKLKEYLQKVIEINDISKLYAANVFFDIIYMQNQQSLDSSYKKREDQQQQMYSVGRNTLISVTERSKEEDSLTSPINQATSEGSKFFNQMIDDLGNQAYDY